MSHMQAPTQWCSHSRSRAWQEVTTCTCSAVMPAPPRYTPPGSRAMPLAGTAAGFSSAAPKSGRGPPCTSSRLRIPTCATDGGHDAKSFTGKTASMLSAVGTGSGLGINIPLAQRRPLDRPGRWAAARPAEWRLAARPLLQVVTAQPLTAPRARPAGRRPVHTCSEHVCTAKTPQEAQREHLAAVSDARAAVSASDPSVECVCHGGHRCWCHTERRVECRL